MRPIWRCTVKKEHKSIDVIGKIALYEARMKDISDIKVDVMTLKSKVK